MPPGAVLLAVALLGCPSLGHGAGSASAAGVAGAGSEPPWEKKLETVFLGLKASVTKISEEQNHLAHEWKRLSKAETTQVAVARVRCMPPRHSAARRGLTSGPVSQAVPLHDGGPVETRSALAKQWMSASSQRSRTGSLQSNAACPAIATGACLPPPPMPRVCSCTCTHARARTHARADARRHTFIPSLARSLTHSLPHIHTTDTRAQRHTHKHARAHTHTHALRAGHKTIYLEPRVWSPAYTVDVLVEDEKAGGKKTVVGTIYANMFPLADFHSNMTLYNTKGEMVSSSRKRWITAIGASATERVSAECLLVRRV